MRSGNRRGLLFCPVGCQLAVDAIYLDRELLIDVGAAHLHGGGHLVVVVIQLLGQKHELANVFHPGELGVDPLHLLVDQLQHLALLGEVPEVGVGDALVGGPLAYVVEIDLDQGGEELAAVADDDRLLDVGLDGFPRKSRLHYLLN